jgi:hypothetical protein
VARDIELTFQRRHPRFTPAGGDPAPRPHADKVTSALAALWKRTAAADAAAEGGDDT